MQYTLNFKLNRDILVVGKKKKIFWISNKDKDWKCERVCVLKRELLGIYL